MDLAGQAALLDSAEAARLLQTALTGDPEVVLPGFTSRLDDLHYRPGAEVTAVYTVCYEDGDGLREEHLLATTAEVTGAVATLRRDGVTIRVWRHPQDPRLPGLAAACDPNRVRGWLAGIGQGPAAPLGLDLLSYRPLRRAVLRARAGDAEFYLKVLRPGRDDQLALRHELLARAGLTVPVLARPADGVLLSPRAPGSPLAELLARGVAVDPAELTGLLDRLPSGLLGLPRRPSWSDRLDFHAATAAWQLPGAGACIADLAGRIAEVLAEHRHGPLVPTHGDCYETNIFVASDGWRFIDVDSAGPGLREDDLACALAHLTVLPVIDPERWAGIPAVIRSWRSEFSRIVDPADLLARTAGVLLSLVASVPASNGPRLVDVAGRHLRDAVAALTASGHRKVRVR